MNWGEVIALFFLVALAKSFTQFLMECWEDKAERKHKDKFLR